MNTRPERTRPRVVFMCIGNACRSPMGEGWRHVAGDRIEVSSGGVMPIGVQPETVSAMAEIGVDIWTCVRPTCGTSSSRRPRC
ncbi:MAG: hypothetical protein R3F34_13515 [Planctomycetota bacterium]